MVQIEFFILVICVKDKKYHKRGVSRTVVHCEFVRKTCRYQSACRHIDPLMNDKIILYNEIRSNVKKIRTIS